MGAVPRTWRERREALSKGASRPTPECPTCGALGDEPCYTYSGTEAKQRHKGRK